MRGRPQGLGHCGHARGHFNGAGPLSLGSPLGAPPALGLSGPAYADAALARLLLPLLAHLLLPLGLALLLEREVQLEGQHLRVVLVEVLAAADLRILQLVQDCEGFARQWLVQHPEEALAVRSYPLVHLIDVALDSEQVGLDARALSAQLGSGLCSKQ